MKIKNEHTGCEHGPEYHQEGLCWKVTNPELEEEQTTKKYCPCTRDKNLIRTYKRLGYTEAEPNDQMITKKCIICGDEVLFNLKHSVCGACKTSSLYSQI